VDVCESRESKQTQRRALGENSTGFSSLFFWCSVQSQQSTGCQLKWKCLSFVGNKKAARALGPVPRKLGCAWLGSRLSVLGLVWIGIWIGKGFSWAWLVHSSRKKGRFFLLPLIFSSFVYPLYPIWTLTQFGCSRIASELLVLFGGELLVPARWLHVAHSLSHREIWHRVCYKLKSSATSHEI